MKLFVMVTPGDVILVILAGVFAIAIGAIWALDKILGLKARLEARWKK